MKKLPIGISDFETVIKGDYYYVDKTLLIQELQESSGQVILITRPRRFGKTLNLSMLKYFFEHTPQNNDHLFYKTNIWKDETYHKLQGKYPVIFLTFKSIKALTWQEAYKHITLLFSTEFKRHAEELLPNIPEYNRKGYEAIMHNTADTAEFTNSLLFLSGLLHRHYKERVVLLIDEYDAPMHAAYTHGYYKELMSFMRSLLTSVLKDNSYLERGVLTGILRAAKEGIFSGLNNLKVFTLLEQKFSDKFGFTPSEVDQLFIDKKITKDSATIKAWYNGYRCGTTHSLYNPWSILECVDNNGTLIPYWTNTSDNLLIKQLLASTDEEIKKDFELLLNDYSVEKQINDAVVLDGIENDSKNIWSLLLFAGYLTFTDYKIHEGKKLCKLAIPNQEIKLLYQELIQALVQESLSIPKVKALLEAMLEGKTERFGELLQEFIANSMSTFDIPNNEPERSYHLFILGLLVMLGDHYEVKSNRESGYGRYDIMIIPKDKRKAGYILEFKKVSTYKEETLSDAAQKALEQIQEKNYKQELTALGISHIIAFGIAFQGKKIYVISTQL